jgi:hypothetical protein
MTPIIVEALREMNLKITGINDLEKPNTFREGIIAWLGDIGNGIGSIFSKKVITEELCVKDAQGETCYNRADLNALLAHPQQPPVSGGGSDQVPVPTAPIEPVAPVEPQPVPPEITTPINLPVDAPIEPPQEQTPQIIEQQSSIPSSTQ